MSALLSPVFDSLSACMKDATRAWGTVKDEAGHTVVHAHWPDHAGDEWFGAVTIKKNYVSYHLMPLYGHPELLDGVSDDLRKRMQGKTCFNFKTVQSALFEELKALTVRCAAQWAAPPGHPRRAGSGNLTSPR